jgi:L-alanine-DL-glutamate epimerase-like enolase superfamily enzyme
VKITEFEVFTLGEPASPEAATWAGISIVLRLTTSDGLVGYGEAVPTSRAKPVMESLKEVGRLYKGKDPFNLELNQHEWHKYDFYLPVSFESTTALSAFDIACWDLMGKYHGVPIHRLLGGTFRQSIRLYSNGWYSDCVTQEQFAARSRKFAAMGYTALKFDPFGSYYDWIDARGLEEAYGRVKAVKDATKGKVDLLIEHHGRFNPNSAIMAAKKLEPLDPLFMEEPIHPDNVEGLRKYRASTGVRVALGERILTKEQAAHVCSNHLTDFLQVDITNIGGVTQAKKVSAIAEAYGVEMAFHNAFGPIQNAVTLQVNATIPNFLIQESFYDVFPEWKRELVRDGTKVSRGHSKVPTKPGLGVDVNERVLEEHRFEGEETFDPDEPVWVVKGTWKRS